MAPAAHIAGMPIEETLLALGGPAAIYAGLITVAVGARRLWQGGRRGPGTER